LSILRKFAGQTAIYGFSTIAARTLSFFLTPVYVRHFSADQYGVLTELYSWTSLISAILTFGMETTYFRYLNKEKNNPEVYNDSFLTLLATSSLFIVLGALNIHFVLGFLQHNVTQVKVDYQAYVQLFLGIILLDNICVIPFAKLRAEGKSVRYAFLKCTNILIYIIFNLLFIFVLPRLANLNSSFGQFILPYFKANWIGYIFISNLIASIFTFILLLPELTSFRFKFNFTLLKNMLGYSWPVLVANISFTINENLDKIYLKALLPQTGGQNLIQLGIYGACYKLAVFLNLFIQGFRLGAEPFFFNHASEPDARKTYAVIMDYFIIIVAIIFLGIVCNIEWLKYFINNRSYWSGLKIVPVILMGYVCLGIYMNLSIWYKLSDQTRYAFYISGIGALITIIMNPILIPLMGYMGSAYTTMSAYFVMMVCSYVWGQKHYPIPYNLRKNLILIGTAVLLVFLSFIVFKRNVYIGNLIFLSFVGLIAWFEKANLKKLFPAKF